MKKRQYKVEYENGVITPLEPIDLKEKQEGMLVLFEDERALRAEDKKVGLNAVLSENSLNKVWDNPEDDVYNDL